MSAGAYNRAEADEEERWHEQQQLNGKAPDLLEFFDLGQLMEEVDAAGAPTYLMKPVWASEDYGMLSAVDKAGKSWLAADAAVSVASGTPWLGIFNVPESGPVVHCVGEGGKRKVVRRYRAIGAARGVDGRDLAIRVCLRVPKLTSELSMAKLEAEVCAAQPKLVIIDPLYLAARGARGSDLYEMGEHLEAAQAIAQRHGAALMIAHHWNQTGTGRGAIRASGAGPSAWGRVLVSAAVLSSRTEKGTKRTSVVLDLDLQGDEVAEETIRIRREVWAEDPDDLGSPLHYEVTRLELELPPDPRTEGFAPSRRRVFAVLGPEDKPLSVQSIGDLLAHDATGADPLRKRTINEALADLAEADLVDSTTASRGRAQLWWIRPGTRSPDDAP